MPSIPLSYLPILLLIGSNLFMTTAWYGHLKFPSAPMWAAVMASWGIALVEYWLAVPANRIGFGTYTAPSSRRSRKSSRSPSSSASRSSCSAKSSPSTPASAFALIGVGAFFIFNGPFK